MMSTNEAPASAGHAQEFAGRCPSPWAWQISLLQGVGNVKIAKGGMHVLLQDLVGQPLVQRAYSKGLHAHSGHPPVVRV